MLPISSLRKCPVCVNLHTEHMIEAIRSSLEEGRAAPGITVGRVGDAYYIVDGHARVEAYRRAEFEEINVGEVLDLGSETDVLIEHVKRNTRSPMNPIKVRGAVALLIKEGVEEPFKTLRLSPVMETAVHVLVRWPSDVLAMVSDLLDKNAGRFSDVYAIPQFFAAFADLTLDVRHGDKRAEEELRGIISYIVQYLESIREEREFTLPGPDQIRALRRVRRQRMTALVAATKSPAKARQSVKQASSEGAEDYDKEEGEPEDAEDSDDGGVGYKAPLLMPDRNKSMVQCTHCGSPQVVDLKTGHVCPVESVAGGMIDVIHDGDGRRAYVLSIKAMKFLGLDRPAEEISPAKYVVVATDRKSDVDRLIRSAKPTARFVVIVSDPNVQYNDDDIGSGKTGSKG